MTARSDIDIKLINNEYVIPFIRGIAENDIAIIQSNYKAALQHMPSVLVSRSISAALEIARKKLHPSAYATFLSDLQKLEEIPDANKLALLETLKSKIEFEKLWEDDLEKKEVAPALSQEDLDELSEDEISEPADRTSITGDLSTIAQQVKNMWESVKGGVESFLMDDSDEEESLSSSSPQEIPKNTTGFLYQFLGGFSTASDTEGEEDRPLLEEPDPAEGLPEAPAPSQEAPADRPTSRY